MTSSRRPTEERRGWPSYLFWGRVRTSTVVLIVAFLATAWLYETYKPAPVVTPVRDTQVVPPGFVPDPSYTWVPRTKVQTATPTTAPTTTTPTTTPESPTETTEPAPSSPAQPPAPGEPVTTPTTVPTPGQPPTTAATPLAPGQTPETTVENRSGRPAPTTTAGVPVPGNGDRP